jgi:hypothetical protein
MSLRFRYKDLKTRHPVPSLGGRLARPRPLVAVTLVGPSNTFVREALLDTGADGADDTVFPDFVAARLGLNLDQAPQGEVAGVASGNVTVRYAQVTLRLTDGREKREWAAWVGFTAAPLKHPLLGFAGCLQFFTAVFSGDREEVELTVNSLYRGT